MKGLGSQRDKEATGVAPVSTPSRRCAIANPPFSFRLANTLGRPVSLSVVGSITPRWGARQWHSVGMRGANFGAAPDGEGLQLLGREEGGRRRGEGRKLHSLARPMVWPRFATAIENMEGASERGSWPKVQQAEMRPNRGSGSLYQIQGDWHPPARPMARPRFGPRSGAIEAQQQRVVNSAFRTANVRGRRLSCSSGG